MRTLQTTTVLMAVSFLGGCVKKSEYDALQVENQALQARVDQASHQLEQSQTDLATLQAQLQQFGETKSQLQKTQQQLQQTQEELKALKAQFEQFRTQRRNAMVGKKFPVLTLDGGKVLRQAEITSVTAEDVSIQHDGGVIKVALADTTDALRWEACYDPQEAKARARENMLAEARAIEARLARERGAPTAATFQPSQNAVDVLRSQLATQRTQLNTEYQMLVAKNPKVLQGAGWNASAPEASPLLNSVSGSRAVLGLSRLQSLRDSILATVQQLRAVDPSAR
ncbi:hypothetical protein [Prosthecobacter sp.]|uniref:hypothetical protein n=1 Tax=Prosthecobacter sp. TaxID=1965333 RepID=UPI001DF5817D|nr:hypothetical protein [Prosthecobacter sp.]MCB1275678.1 hypothetical protein [Prosthecobacter sp.]